MSSFDTKNVILPTPDAFKFATVITQSLHKLRLLHQLSNSTPFAVPIEIKVDEKGSDILASIASKSGQQVSSSMSGSTKDLSAHIGKEITRVISERFFFLEQFSQLENRRHHLQHEFETNPAYSIELETELNEINTEFVNLSNNLYKVNENLNRILTQTPDLHLNLQKLNNSRIDVICDLSHLANSILLDAVSLKPEDQDLLIEDEVPSSFSMSLSTSKYKTTTESSSSSISKIRLSPRNFIDFVEKLQYRSNYLRILNDLSTSEAELTQKFNDFTEKIENEKSLLNAELTSGNMELSKLQNLIENSTKKIDMEVEYKREYLSSVSSSLDVLFQEKLNMLNRDINSIENEIMRDKENFLLLQSNLKNDILDITREIEEKTGLNIDEVLSNKTEYQNVQTDFQKEKNELEKEIKIENQNLIEKQNYFNRIFNAREEENRVEREQFENVKFEENRRAIHEESTSQEFIDRVDLLRAKFNQFAKDNSHLLIASKDKKKKGGKKGGKKKKK